MNAKKQTNINIDPEQDVKIKKMMFEEKELNRSAFFRRLVDAEYERRNPEAEKQEVEE